MTIKTIDVRDTPPLKDIVSLVASGTEVVLVEGGKPVARVVPVTKRIPGLHPGSVWTSNDFDEPLPDDFWAGN